jgi:hypothetical protein
MIVVIVNLNHNIKCNYLVGRRCLLKTAFTSEAFATPQFCRDVCGTNDPIRQKEMLKTHGLVVDNLPYPTTLKKAHTHKKECGAQKQKAERQKLLDQLPKGVALTVNLKRHLKQIAVHYVKTREYYVSDEHEKARLAKCDKCPDGKMVVKDGVMRCALRTCGCYLDNPSNRPVLEGKAKYWATPCDNGHWDGIDEVMRGGGKEKMDPRS